jgi:hypothetical protein
MDLTVEFVDPTLPAAPVGWDEFVREAGAHPVWHWTIVHAMAGGRPGRCVAGLFRDGGRVTGVVFAGLIGPGRRGPYVGVAEVTCPGASALPGLMLGGELPAALHPDRPTDAGRLAAAVAAFEAAVRREYGGRIRAVFYRSVYADALPVLTGRGLSLIGAGLPVTMFYNRFATYEDYLASLSSSRRAGQRRLCRLIDKDPGITASFGPAPDDVDLARFNALADATSRRHETRRWPRPGRLTHAQRAAMLRVPGALVARYDGAHGELVGLGIYFDHAAVPLAGPWGAVDPHDGGPRGLWFDHHARLLRWAIGSGRAGVIGGKGLADLKGELGYVSVPQWLVLRRLPARRTA